MFPAASLRPSRKFTVMIKQSIMPSPVPLASPSSPLGSTNGDGVEAGGTGQEVILCFIIATNLREKNDAYGFLAIPIGIPVVGDWKMEAQGRKPSFVLPLHRVTRE